jgi:hypothetical protein
MKVHCKDRKIGHITQGQKERTIQSQGQKEVKAQRQEQKDRRTPQRRHKDRAGKDISETRTDGKDIPEKQGKNKKHKGKAQLGDQDRRRDTPEPTYIQGKDNQTTDGFRSEKFPFREMLVF